MRKRGASGLGYVEPQLPTLVDNPPEGGDWIHEIKFDGYRSQVVIDAGQVRIFTRRGHDWTAKYHPLVRAAEELGLDRAIMDGEIVAADLQGKPRFGELRATISNRPEELIFVAFDLLHLDDDDLRRMGVEERRHILRDLIPTQGRIQFSDELEGEARIIFAKIERAGLEGMVSKRLGSRYRSGPSKEWLKTKCYDVGEFDIIGVQRERGKPAMVLMADKGRYVGGAFVTLPQGIRERLWARVQARSGAKPPAGLAAEKAEWIKPGLRGRVKFLRGEEKLRHASLQTFQENGDEHQG